MIKTAFGERIRLLRKEKGLTQGQLADGSGLAMRFVQEIESGDKQPTVSTLFKLSAALELTPGELLDGAYKDWVKQGKPE